MLQGADEAVDVADEHVQSIEAGRRADVHQAEFVAQLLVLPAQRCVVIGALQQTVDLRAVEALFESVQQRLAFLQRRLQGQPVGEHAQRAGLVDDGGILVRIVGEQQGTEHADQGQRHQQGEVAAEAQHQ
ncbi:hypothetical protein D3C80_1397890 [compost metagenome]